MSNYYIQPELTDEQVAEMVVKFNTTEEVIRQQWEAAKALGPEGALAEMDELTADIERTVDVVVDDVVARYLGRGDRIRAMGDFYREGWDALSAEEISEADVGDMFLKMTIAIFKLAEAREHIAALMDSSRRVGREDDN